MKRFVIVMVAILGLVPLGRADSIDDAEAKRRGVPVAQVQAENALAKQKARTAALEKEVADLQKKIAALQGQTGDATANTASAAPTTTSAPPTTGAAPAIGGAASQGTTAEPSLAFDGPREASPKYDDFVARYLAGDWDKLTADMEAAKKEIAAMPAGNVADLTYIARVVAESRPAWWDQVKSGKVKQFRQLIWKQPVVINYQNGGIGGTVSLATVNGELNSTVSWPLDNMDSHDPLMVVEYGLNIPGDFGFQRADAANSVAWQLIGNAGAIATAGFDKTKTMSDADKQTLTRYALFWQNISAAYYGTPPVRRLMAAMSLASLEPAMTGNPNWIGRRPFGSALLIELTINKKYYKGLEVQPIIGLGQMGNEMEGMEAMVAHPCVMQFLKARLTLEQDRHLRDMAKTLALSNSKWSESRLLLPGGQGYDLEPGKDGPLVSERMKVVNQ